MTVRHEMPQSGSHDPDVVVLTSHKIIDANARFLSST